ncbi:MAG TPA: DUF4350 domain-containing protein [Marinagarivorans sp.]
MFSRLLLIIVLVLAALLGYGLYNAIEFYEQERDLGWRIEARQNPYLAVQMFAEQRGQTVEVFDSIHKVGELNQYDFIYMTDSQLVFSQQRLDALLEWVRGGGHVMVGATAVNSGSGDKLLAYINIEVLDSGFEGDFGFEDAFESIQNDRNDESQETTDEQDRASKADKPSADAIAEEVGERLRHYNKTLKEQQALLPDEPVLGAEANIALQERGIESQALTHLRFGDDDYSVRVSLNRAYDLFHPAMNNESWQADNGELIYWEGTEQGDHFAQIELGEGLISVTTDSNIFDSHAVGLFDHAYLWQLLSGDRSAVIYGSNMPSLGQILWRLLPELMLILLVALGLKIWQVAGYFGPKRNQNSLARRSFNEHLSASAGFLWRNGHQQQLLKPLRDDILASYSLTVLGFDQMSSEAQARWLAEQNHMADNTVFEALFSVKALSDDGFTRCVQTLQKLRGRL